MQGFGFQFYFQQEEKIGPLTILGQLISHFTHFELVLEHSEDYYHHTIVNVSFSKGNKVSTIKSCQHCL